MSTKTAAFVILFGATLLDVRAAFSSDTMLALCRAVKQGDRLFVDSLSCVPATEKSLEDATASLESSESRMWSGWNYQVPDAGGVIPPSDYFDGRQANPCKSENELAMFVCPPNTPEAPRPVIPVLSPCLAGMCPPNTFDWQTLHNSLRNQGGSDLSDHFQINPLPSPPQP
jgi:hypothetical protein